MSGVTFREAAPARVATSTRRSYLPPDWRIESPGFQAPRAQPTRRTGLPYLLPPRNRCERAVGLRATVRSLRSIPCRGRELAVNAHAATQRGPRCTAARCVQTGLRRSGTSSGGGACGVDRARAHLDRGLRVSARRCPADVDRARTCLPVARLSFAQKPSTSEHIAHPTRTAAFFARLRFL